MVKIGVNTPLMKELIAEYGVYEAFKKVSEIGFHYFELSQFNLSPENVEILQKAREDFGIEINAISVDVVPMPDLIGGNPRMNVQNDYEQIVAACKTLGCRHCRTFLFGTGEFGTQEGVKAYAESFENAAKKLAEAGLDYSYHGHNFEFAKFDGKIALRIMKDMTEYTKFELCSYWVQAGGLDTARLILEFGREGRVSICHLKDYRIMPLTAEYYAEHFAHQSSSSMLHSIIQFAEAGEGNLDIPSIIDACDEVGVEYIFLEQDQHYGRTELEILQTDYDNLCAMGYKDRM